MRRRLLEDFAQWARDYEGDTLRVDAYERAQRLHKLLQAVAPIEPEDEQSIPSDSHLREFIGGSAYEY
jgi:1,4-alpha-glucan branching enzyme